MRHLCGSAMIVLGLLTACATPGGALLNESGDAVLATRLQFVNARLEPVTEPPASQGRPAQKLPDHVWLVLGHTAGRLAGPAADGHYLRFPLHREPPALERRSFGHFELNLGFIGRSLALSAAPLQTRPEDRALVLAPADARISRLLLGVWNSLQQPMAAVTGLRDAANGDELLLLHADRPCHIAGVIDLSRTGTFVDAHAATRDRFTGLYAHDVVIPRAGLHWLRVRPLGPGRFQVTRTEAPAQVSVFVLLSSVAAAGP